MLTFILQYRYEIFRIAALSIAYLCLCFTFGLIFNSLSKGTLVILLPILALQIFKFVGSRLWWL